MGNSLIPLCISYPLISKFGQESRLQGGSVQTSDRISGHIWDYCDSSASSGPPSGLFSSSGRIHNTAGGGEMGTSVAVFFSSSPESGNTARLLSAFMKGLERGGDEIRTFDVKEVNPSPCTGELHCWFKDPGNCYIQDGMQEVYAVLRCSDAAQCAINGCLAEARLQRSCQ